MIRLMIPSTGNQEATTVLAVMLVMVMFLVAMGNPRKELCGF
jgi:hypothetical protein